MSIETDNLPLHNYKKRLNKTVKYPLARVDLYLKLTRDSR